jgi:Flp pilus assembly protein TadG
MRERGAAAVEFAIIFPMLLLMLGGIIDFGRYFYAQVVMSNAVQEGARARSIGLSDPVPYDRALLALTDQDMRDHVALDVQQCQANVSNPTYMDAVATATYSDFQWIILQPAMSLFGAGDDLPQPAAEAVLRCVS